MLAVDTLWGLLSPHCTGCVACPGCRTVFVSLRCVCVCVCVMCVMFVVHVLCVVTQAIPASGTSRRRDAEGRVTRFGVPVP